MLQQPAMLESESVAGVALRVAFVWLGDRFGHTISAVEAAGRIVTLCESVEGSAAEAWPTSPPLQSLSLESLPDGRQVALLVGMAGRSHWSASVESPSGERAIVFDVACRWGGEEPRLGSSYRSLPVTDNLCLTPEPHGPAAATARQDGAQRWVIAPVIGAPLPRTIRWKYRVSLDNRR